MQFDNPYDSLRQYQTVSNDEEDFSMPYETPSEIEREIMEWKYYRLSNLPAHIYQVRVGDSLIFGRGF